MMTLDDFKPGRFIVICAVIGAADDGGDYIHSIGRGRYGTLEVAQAAREADRRYWAGDTTLGDLLPRDRQAREYRIFEAEGWCPVE